MNRKMRRSFGCLAVLALLAAGVLLEIHRSASTLIVTGYTLEEPIEHPVRVVFLADLHNAQFGDGNQKLVDMVLEQEPDFVFMGGDMCNEDEEDISVVYHLIEDISKTVPVYFSYGNHEKTWESRFEKDVMTEAENAGAVVLDLQYEDISVCGVPVRIGGYYGYYRYPGMITQDTKIWDREYAWCDDFEDTTRLKLLLCHIPTQFLDWERKEDFHAGLAFCSHYHGGQIQIPYVGGLVAPYVGFFPPYTKGLFHGKGTDVVLTTGLGTNHPVPRFNNPPEIVTVDLVPEREE